MTPSRRLKRLLCLLLRRHGRRPRDGQARTFDLVDVICGRCGQPVIQGLDRERMAP